MANRKRKISQRDYVIEELKDAIRKIESRSFVIGDYLKDTQYEKGTEELTQQIRINLTRNWER